MVIGLLFAGVKAAVAAEETNLVKYFIAGEILPFAAFDGIIGPAFRFAPFVKSLVQ